MNTVKLHKSGGEFVEKILFSGSGEIEKNHRFKK